MSTNELADHLEGLMDSLDEVVTHEDIHEQLTEALRMARENESAPTVAEYYGEKTLLCIEVDWSEPLLPRLNGPFEDRAAAERWAGATIENGSWSFAHISPPAPMNSEPQNA